MYMARKTIRPRLFALLAAASLAMMAGCSDEPDTGRPIPVPNNGTADTGLDTGPDASPDLDTTPDPDATEDLCEQVTCEADERCVNGVCEPTGPEGASCAAPIALGVLGTDEPLVASADPSAWPNLFNTGCSSDNDSGQAVFSFTLASDSLVTLEFTDSTAQMVLEVRGSDCSDSTGALTCGTFGQEFYGVAGATYHLVVEGRQGTQTGQFSVELSASELACSPPGAWTCDGDQRVQCYAGTELRYFQCAAGCDDGVCRGETCDVPIVVEGSIAVTGDAAANEHNFNFADQPSCSTAGTAGPITTGQDIVFHLPGVVAGQTVAVDTTHQPGGVVIAVLKSCDITAGCAAADDTTGKLEWEADQSGDYYVIIDRFTAANSPFDYRIEIRD